jgi:type IV fimbrial biogenesis protein FimT
MGSTPTFTTAATTTRKRQRGVSLIEACTVIAITSIVVGTSVPNLQGLIDGRRLQGAATTLATDIQLVRTEAVARNQPLRLSVYPSAEGNCYVVHTGAAAQCSCSGSGAALCGGGAEAIKTVHLRAVDRVALQANVGSLLFDPLHGTSTPAGTLRLVGQAGREIRHVINVMGRVRSCSPLAAVAGYTAC